MSKHRVVFTFKTVDCPNNSSEQIEIFTLEELSIIKDRDYTTEEELNELLKKEWKKWRERFIDGGFSIYE